MVAYIASHYRRDKIWLRRTRPDQRQYQVRSHVTRLPVRHQRYLPACKGTLVPSSPHLLACAALTTCMCWRQVVIAVDNSRSMAENGCGGAACQATVLLARALTRLEVGSLGIVRFGGGAPPAELHPLGQPFTDAQGPGVLAGLRFDQVRLQGNRLC